MFVAAGAGIATNLIWSGLFTMKKSPLGHMMMADLDGLIPGILANAIAFFILVRASRPADDDLTAAPQTSA